MVDSALITKTCVEECWRSTTTRTAIWMKRERASERAEKKKIKSERNKKLDDVMVCEQVERIRFRFFRFFVTFIQLRWSTAVSLLRSFQNLFYFFSSQIIRVGRVQRARERFKFFVVFGWDWGWTIGQICRSVSTKMALRHKWHNVNELGRVREANNENDRHKNKIIKMNNERRKQSAPPTMSSSSFRSLNIRVLFFVHKINRQERTMRDRRGINEKKTKRDTMEWHNLQIDMLSHSCCALSVRNRKTIYL